MKFSPFTLAATVAAILGAASADSGLTILSPGGPNLWWVTNSQNVLLWDCADSPYTNFTVLIKGTNLPQIAWIAQQPNYQCSLLVSPTQSNLPPATGYTISLADPFNNTNLYTTSQPFEIKAAGSTYPASSATPSATGSSTGSQTAGSGSKTSSGSSSSKTSGNNAAAGLKVSAWGVVAAVAAAVVAA